MNPNFLNSVLAGESHEEYLKNKAIDELYDEIEDAAVYIATMKVDNYDLCLEIDDIDVDVDTKTARIMLSNDTSEYQLDYDHESGNYEITKI